MLLGATDRQIRLIDRLAACFTDYRAADLVVHEVPSLVGQRVFGIALGYEDLLDHDQLRHDPVLAVLGGKLEARRADCAPLAGKSTLNRLELSRPEPTRYHKISYDAAAIGIGRASLAKLVRARVIGEPGMVLAGPGRVLEGVAISWVSGADHTRSAMTRRRSGSGERRWQNWCARASSANPAWFSPAPAGFSKVSRSPGCRERTIMRVATESRRSARSVEKLIRRA